MKMQGSGTILSLKLRIARIFSSSLRFGGLRIKKMIFNNTDTPLGREIVTRMFDGVLVERSETHKLFVLETERFMEERHIVFELGKQLSEFYSELRAYVPSNSAEYVLLRYGQTDGAIERAGICPKTDSVRSLRQLMIDGLKYCFCRSAWPEHTMTYKSAIIPATNDEK